MTDAREPTDETLEEVAAGWVARQRSGAMSEQEARDLDLWLAREPAHREAFDHVEGIWRAAAGVRTDPQIMALRDAAMSAHPPRPRRWLAAGGIAAALALAVFGGWSALSPGTLPAAPALMGAPNEQVFSTGLGQTATVTLGDGSVVTLDTGTRLRARADGARRLVRLERGQAFFKVAKDPARPFEVTAGGKTITALGTAFNVRLDGRRVEVVLAEGRVRVSGAEPPPLLAPIAPKPPAAEMAPGSRLVAAGSQDWRLVRVDVEAATSWRQGQLVFVRRPLGDVADEINRYSEKKVVIRDDELARAPITGGFALGDVDAFVQAVEGYGLAYVASETDSAVVLRPSGQENTRRGVG